MQKVYKRFLTIVLAFALCFGITAVFRVSADYVVADAATGTYYSKITATGGTQLLGQLHDLICTSRTKYSSYADCKTFGRETDPGKGSNTVMEFYTQQDISYSKWNVSGGWNREHVWPKSDSNGLWKDNTVGGGADLHHVRPSEKELNADRGNQKYGEVANGTPLYQYGTDFIGGYTSGGTFEPMDNVKGDVARILMYVYTHYNTYTNSIFGGNAKTNGSLGQSSYFGTLNFTHIISAGNEAAAKKLLLEWNKSDPVDEIEISRNEAVYSIQRNRNPFIDHPEYADAIWGNGSVINPDPKPDEELKSIAFDASAFTLNVGQSRTLKVITTPGGISAPVSWSSSDNSVATAVNGVVTAKGEGTAVITATSTVNPSIKTSATVTVLKPSTPEPSEDFEAGTYRMALNITATDMNKKLYFTGALSGNYGATDEDADRAAEVVAEQTEYGYTLKVGAKYLEIEAYTNANGATSTRLVLVDESTGDWLYDNELNVLTWTLTTNGKSYYLGTYTNSSGKTYETISSSDVKYISGDNASNVGVTQFPVSFEKSGGKPEELESITVNPSAINLKEGGEFKLSVISNPSTVTADVNWTSSDISVATVSADGTVTAVKAGTVTITATSKTNPSIKATATVTVTADRPVDPDPGPGVDPNPDEKVEAFITAVKAIDGNGTLAERRAQISTAIAEYNKLTAAGKAQVTGEYTILNNAIKQLADGYNSCAQGEESNAISGIVKTVK